MAYYNLELGSSIMHYISSIQRKKIYILKEATNLNCKHWFKSRQKRTYSCRQSRLLGD